MVWWRHNQHTIQHTIARRPRSGSRERPSGVALQCTDTWPTSRKLKKNAFFTHTRLIQSLKLAIVFFVSILFKEFSFEGPNYTCISDQATWQTWHLPVIFPTNNGSASASGARKDRKTCLRRFFSHNSLQGEEKDWLLYELAFKITQRYHIQGSQREKMFNFRFFCRLPVLMHVEPYSKSILHFEC